ncbi:hypothetical protein HYPSUDRAFT_207357 [Hypholoma sublateritium FD-334 SS-4]|uniref:Uncharacterized protein n=1 Tax=Hypholoma sublateritium (strain FD-334 SS-4) TaxID=945553 RepID=A0A0D2P6K2_HYPSF|nr:hypothetical protein HYPSUDRAFT_207357 [Hypholoma sublateritium FD-334 SS-4]
MSGAPPLHYSRIAVVDDTDPSMVFTGAWNHDQGISGIATPHEEEAMGPAYNNTATSTIYNTSRFQFDFSGTYIKIMGGINFEPTNTTFASCLIDGAVVSNVSSVNVVGTNGNTLCASSSLSDSHHTLSIDLGLGSIGMYMPAAGANGAPNCLWIDSVLYVPTATVAMDEVPALIVYPDDTSLEYLPRGSWDTIPTTFKSPILTNQPNANITFMFNGTSVNYYGHLTGKSGANNTTAAFTIDGQSPSQQVPLVSWNLSSTPANTPIFQSGPLPEGQHTLTVVYQGNSSTAALSLESIIFQTSPLDTSITNITRISPTSTPSPSSSEISRKSNSEVVGVVAGIFGGFAAAIIGATVLFFLRRWRKKKDQFVRIFGHRHYSILFQLSAVRQRQRVMDCKYHWPDLKKKSNGISADIRSLTPSCVLYCASAIP